MEAHKMYSIGDLIDKLVIENIKIFSLRYKLHSDDLSDEDYVNINTKMIMLNSNRSTLCNLLDNKLDNVIAKKEVNCIFKTIKTYE